MSRPFHCPYNASRSCFGQMPARVGTGIAIFVVLTSLAKHAYAVDQVTTPSDVVATAWQQAEGACTCVGSGRKSGGVSVPYEGCVDHLNNSAAWCYVTEGAACGLAASSPDSPGATWALCLDGVPVASPKPVVRTAPLEQSSPAPVWPAPAPATFPPTPLPAQAPVPVPVLVPASPAPVRFFQQQPVG